ncbi:hypothetical protein SCHPADRAFT_481101 [Schizopora paradoxa]|uniref:F-box domain-containing protein n=1 Tax=Schizopora paradoxa TaxID=27342 RepID=A0A0H2RHA2_9AGAM|nr:hypothetical protein SCHPADRAFT_481101 [Schizopora paradoxa]
MIRGRFPAEIVVEIFGYHLSQDLYIDEEKKKPKFITKTTPHLTLTQVCHKWRALILSVERFWTSICLGGIRGRYSVSLFYKHRKLLELWAKRARNRPLSLVIEYGGDFWENDTSQEAAITLMETICSYSSRMVHLDARCPGSLMIPLVQAISNESPKMQDISLELTGHRSNVDEIPILFLPGSTKLKNLRVEGGVKLRWRTTDMRMCKNIEKMVYHQNVHRLDLKATLNDAYSALSLCPSLKTFAFTVCNSQGFMPPSIEPHRENLLLPSLLCLWLNTVYDADAGPLLVSLKAENLKQLVVNGSLVDATDDWNYLYHFLENSKPRLRALSIIGIEITSSNLVKCLRLCHGIEDLEIDGRVLNNFVASSLCWRQSEDDEEQLLPALRCLFVVGASTKYVTVNELVKMVHSRCARPNRSYGKSEEGDLGPAFPVNPSSLRAVTFVAADASIVDYISQQKIAWGFSENASISRLVETGALNVLVDDYL